MVMGCRKTPRSGDGSLLQKVNKINVALNGHEFYTAQLRTTKMLLEIPLKLSPMPHVQILRMRTVLAKALVDTDLPFRLQAKLCGSKLTQTPE